MQKINKFGMAVIASVLAVSAQAATPDAATVITTATTAFETAGALAVLILGFVIVRRIIKKLAN